MHMYEGKYVAIYQGVKKTFKKESDAKAYERCGCEPAVANPKKTGTKKPKAKAKTKKN